MIKLEAPRHKTGDCPCGHSPHIADLVVTIVPSRGRIVQGPTPMEGIAAVRCEECEAIEKATPGVKLKLTFVRNERVAQFNIRAGLQVSCDGRSCSVVSVEPVTKLNGKVATGYTRVALRRLA